MKATREPRSRGLLVAFALLALVFVWLGDIVFAAPDECTGSRTYWEGVIRGLQEEIDKIRRDFLESGEAVFDANVRSQFHGAVSIHNFKTGDPMMDTIGRADFTSMTPRQAWRTFDAAYQHDIDFMKSPSTTPHEPGKNSLVRNEQRHRHEIPDLRTRIHNISRYLDRCWPEAAYWQFVPPFLGYQLSAWNCSGLDGLWDFEIVSSELSGHHFTFEGTFTLPPEPESGSWLTPAFSFAASSTLVGPDFIETVTVNWENVVLEFTKTDENTTLVSVVSQTNEAHIVINYTEEYRVCDYAVAGFVGGKVIIGRSSRCD